MSNDNSIDEFYALKFLAGFLTALSYVVIGVGVLIAFSILNTSTNIAGAGISVLIGLTLSLLFIISAQVIKLFLKIEKNTQNQELITLLKSFKEDKIPSQENTVTVTSNDDSISNNKAKYGLENVKYIKCSSCGNHNYVNYLDKLVCSQCGSNISNGERFSS